MHNGKKMIPGTNAGDHLIRWMPPAGGRQAGD